MRPQWCTLPGSGVGRPGLAQTHWHQQLWATSHVLVSIPCANVAVYVSTNTKLCRNMREVLCSMKPWHAGSPPQFMLHFWSMRSARHMSRTDCPQSPPLGACSSANGSASQRLAALTVWYDRHPVWRKACTQHCVLLAGVRHTDDMVHIRQDALEHLVGEDAARVGKAKQGVVCEHDLQASTAQEVVG